MKIEYEGESYLFDFDQISVKQGIKIEKHTGIPLTEWGDLLQGGGHLVALQALGWLVLNGGQGAVDDADFKMVPFGEAFTKALAELAAEQAAKEAAAAVPTAAAPASNGRMPAAVPDLSPASSVPVSP